MDDKHELLILPNKIDASLVVSGSRSSLFARGRNDSSVLVISRGPGPTFISAKVLTAVIARTIYAVSRYDDWRNRALHYALLILKPTSLTMVGTNGHMLSFAEKSNERILGVQDEKQVLIPLLPLQELYQILLEDRAESVLFVEDEGTSSFHVCQSIISWVNPTEKYPDFESVMKHRDDKKFVVVSSTEIAAAIEHAADRSNERSGEIFISLQSNELKISSSSVNYGETEVIIKTPYFGDPIDERMYSGYILDFLKALNYEGKVRMEFNGFRDAIEMRPEIEIADLQWRHLLMPMIKRANGIT